MNRVLSDLSINNTKTHSHDIGLSFFRIFHKSIAFMLIIWLNNGLFTFVMPYVPNFLRWGAFFLWLGAALIIKPKFTKTFIAQCWPLLIFISFTLISSIFFTGSYLSMYIKSLFYLVMVYSIFLYYYDDKYSKWKRNVVIFLEIDYAFIAVNTYLHLKENPQLARFLSTATETQELYLGDAIYRGVGSFAYFYGLVPIILLLGYLFFNKFKYRWISLLAIIGLTIVTLKASFTMSILFMFTFLIVIAVTKYVNKYLLILVAPLSFLFLVLSQKPLGMFFKNMSTIDNISTDVAVRLSEISFFLLNTTLTGDLLARLDRYSMSISAFSHNFIFGITIPYTHGFKEGGHSSWLDLFALFGIFAMFFIVFLIGAYRYLLINSPDKFKPFVSIFWLYFACLGIVNTLLFPNLFTVWFIFLPFFIKHYHGTKQPEKETN